MEATLRSNGINNGIVVLAGLSNSYSHYIATPEEYVFQRYEAASTLYGPATLGVYLQEFTRLMNNLLAGTTVPPGPPPPNLNQTVRIQLSTPVALHGRMRACGCVCVCVICCYVVHFFRLLSM